jgi:hypothetical protein
MQARSQKDAPPPPVSDPTHLAPLVAASVTEPAESAAGSRYAGFHRDAARPRAGVPYSLILPRGDQVIGTTAFAWRDLCGAGCSRMPGSRRCQCTRPHCCPPSKGVVPLPACVGLSVAVLPTVYFVGGPRCILVLFEIPIQLCPLRIIAALTSLYPSLALPILPPSLQRAQQRLHTQPTAFAARTIGLW